VATYLVDGYNLMNVMFARGDDTPLEQKRDQLLERLADHAGAVGVKMVVVFDGKEGMDHPPEPYPQIQVVFSKRSGGADQVIERLSRELDQSEDQWVVTGDYLEQKVIFRRNVFRKPPRELMDEMGKRGDSQRFEGRQASPAPQRASGRRFRLSEMMDADSLEALREIADDLVDPDVEGDQ